MSKEKLSEFNHAQKNNPELQAGILKEREKKELEKEIIEKLRFIGKKLSKKELSELLAQIETTKNIESLKNQLKGGSEQNKEALNLILSLYESIRSGAKEGISELRIDLEKVLQPPTYSRKSWSHFSDRFTFTKTLEQSELWTKIHLDIAWIANGTLDSLIDAIQVLYALLEGLIRLPHDFIKDIQENFSSK